jgi:flagellar protein FlaG
MEMESIQLDLALRAPVLEHVQHRAANATTLPVAPQRPESDDGGPKRATHDDRAGTRPSLHPNAADPAGTGKPDDAATQSDSAQARADEAPVLSEHSLEIRYSEEHRRFVIKVLDTATGEVIREIPPEQLLEAASRLDKIRGLIFDEKS